MQWRSSYARDKSGWDGSADPIFTMCNDWTTTQSVLSNDTTTACHPMVSTKGLHPWMATTIEV
jgi:hypothetical protein